MRLIEIDACCDLRFCFYVTVRPTRQFCHTYIRWHTTIHIHILLAHSDERNKKVDRKV